MRTAHCFFTVLTLGALAVCLRAAEATRIVGEDRLRPVPLEMFGRRHYYQLPESEPKGLVAVLPGCARSARGFWPHSTNHPDFYGFPEDVSHTRQILTKGYAILVMTPTDTRTLCWSNKGEDPFQIATLITAFQSTNSLAGRPLYLLGASSGGGLAVRLASGKTGAALGISGIIAEVATRAAPTETTPPIVWIIMQRDTNSLTDITAHMAAMRRMGKPHGFAIQEPRRITPAFFSEQMKRISARQSAEMVMVLRDIGLIDAEGNLLEDPKGAATGGARQWDIQLRKRLPWLDASPATSLTFRTSGIWQALLAAWGRHEHTAMYTTAALEWFERGGKDDFSILAKQHALTKPGAW